MGDKKVFNLKYVSLLSLKCYKNQSGRDIAPNKVVLTSREHVECKRDKKNGF